MLGDNPGAAIDVAMRELLVSLDPAGFEWFGVYRALSQRRVRSLKSLPRNAPLIGAMTDCLYENFYCVGSPTPYLEYPHYYVQTDNQFVQMLRDAGFNKIAWTEMPVENITPTALVGSLGGISVYLDRNSQLRRRENGLPISADNGEEAWPDVVAAGGRSWTLHASPGFLLLFGRNDLHEAAPHRVYSSLHAHLAAEWIATATRHLDYAQVKFRLKALAHPLDYSRRLDTSVIYIDLRARGAQRALADAYREASHCFRDGVPALTRWIAPGLSVAESPPGGESFGRHRCGLIAEARLHAAEVKLTKPEDVHSCCEVVFLSHGIDPSRPYKQQHSDEGCIEQFETLICRSATNTADRWRQSSGAVPAEKWLMAAKKIGQRLAADAFWYERRCQWIGSTTLPGSPLTARTLPSCLYNGTAGIGHFLLELGYRTQSEEFLETGTAAMRQALFDISEPAGATGLYAGSLGIALIAARSALALGNGSVVDEAVVVARHVATSQAAPAANNPDLLLGLAGKILGLLSFSVLLRDDSFRGHAIDFGETLLKIAHRDGPSWSWHNPTIASNRHLSGMSHGIAGIVLALAELWRITKDRSFLDAMIGAMHYEDLTFSHGRSNWPDHRGLDRSRQFINFWCHGGAGIILSRLHSSRLMGRRQLPKRVVNAIETLRQTVHRNIGNESANFNLCHGLAGNCEILMEASRWGNAALDWQDCAAKTAAECCIGGIECHGISGTWPCGWDVDDPSLLLGRAGIGYAYLRLYDPSAPSVLAFDPAEWGRVPGAI
ncbi:lanthionine synthetase LanC family protein [Rhizobium leguminosarum]|uniref:lanthionine synthetase LanC family protein n=1 Tax=Rhizobium leguminosarum TaxID=384 RepID=UPI00293DAE63|nr:lanthionine synthetase LanC family protein [Rhizobium leguminosarum]MDV4166167.1 lanthionine synthetase LanC family protein [Rhizobium leguminosarum]MDV4176651.1 lanthionine synthetase LanC family protein [Rhizobium leguminosarum]